MTKAPPDPHILADILAPLEQTSGLPKEVLKGFHPKLGIREVGTLFRIEQGIAQATGLPGIKVDEVVRLPKDHLGIAFDITPENVGIVLLDESSDLSAGMEVSRTNSVLSVPVGEALIGRVVDSVCRPLDSLGPIRSDEYLPIERPAPQIMDRLPVTVQLQTGIKAIDPLIPIGRGQRQLIVGDRQTGKTAIAIQTIMNQKGQNVICIYCAIGKENASVAKVIDDLGSRGALEYTIVMTASGDDPPGLQFVAPYSATSIGEYFMARGKDVLVVYDDLTHHARIYREISLLLRRPPGREAFPGDIFYIHSRLLERSTHLKEEFGGGSLTALPIVETEAQNISAYIPTNLISITDGQVYLSPDLFQRGQLPAVDEGRSVSRVGGKTQLKAYRSVAGDLRLSYSLFEELETFSRIGTRLDEKTKKILAKGERVREVLKQSQFEPMSACEQVAILVAVTNGAFTDIALDEIEDIEREIRSIVKIRLTEVCSRIEANEDLSKEDRDALTGLAREIVQNRVQGERYAQP
ncbi:MAG TPA: alternate F1F0 ATPase, F1 subunit alpha [Deltaproteobacteria bacterium]|jgi:F-type H+-transporting ATPase subunit alpha|nr:alternate F1F0 ATPase, F1 subunit alpha [Deltaproteobacteria bacterium]HQJ07944.1 alternate F1F0 ATPase, F1 subunit alpha [Deltaproteobacteria bacterium]